MFLKLGNISNIKIYLMSKEAYMLLGSEVKL